MMKLTWPEIGMIAEPGQYEYRSGMLTITSDDLAIWQSYRNAAFTVIETAPASGSPSYRLGTFELRDDWNISPSER